MAAILAYFAANDFPVMLPDGITPRVRAVLFAPGRAGSWAI